MSYRVFARKYRPQTFEEVVGQDAITRTLQNAISGGRVAQAYLFVGPRGIGKTSTARILAKALNCVNGPTPHPCGKCDACEEIAEGRSLDVLEIDGASNNGVENIRELRENAAYAPARGPYKIYLIDEVHMLSPGAFNALLKTLEEPPEHVKFIFATTEAQKVPATITSRCQRFDLRRIATELIADHLLTIAKNEKISLDRDAAEAIARGAEGGLRDAEGMLDQAVAFCGRAISAPDVMNIFGFTPRDVILSLMERILAGDVPGSLEILGREAAAGRDLSRLLADLIGHARDLLVAGASAQKPAQREKLLCLLDHFAETETRMRWAPDKKLQLDVAVIKAVHLLEQASLDDVLERLAALGGGAAPAAPPAAAPALRPSASPAPSAAPAPAASSASSAPPSAPAAAAPEAPSPEPAIETSIAWDRVASSYRTSIKFRWLTKGVFAGSPDPGTLRVQVPASCSRELKSVVGELGRKDAEGKLEAALGRRIKLLVEVSDELTEPEDALVEPPPAPAPEVVPQAAEAPDPAEQFKNDPLIKKALEIFAGRIHTSTP